jgi:hypothetical protein
MIQGVDREFPEANTKNRILFAHPSGTLSEIANT